MSVSVNDSLTKVKSIFYSQYEDNKHDLKVFANDLASSINGCDVSYMYLNHDGIHFGFTYNGDVISEKELSDIIGTSVSDYIARHCDDRSLIANVSSNINNYIKLLVIDQEDFSVVI